MPAATEEHVIYRHINRASKKCYVGQTSRGIVIRWKHHVLASRKGRGCSHFGAAIRKHGPDAFDHEVLETCATQEAANEAEQWWIAHFGSDDPVLGYNLTPGGRVVKPRRKPKVSEGALRDLIQGTTKDEYNGAGLGHDFPNSTSFVRIYGKTFREIRDGTRRNIPHQWVTEDRLRESIVNGRMGYAMYNAARVSLGPGFPVANQIRRIYGKTFFEIRDGLPAKSEKGHVRESVSSSAMWDKIRGVRIVDYVRDRVGWGRGFPAAHLFPRVYGSTYAAFRDGPRPVE